MVYISNFKLIWKYQLDFLSKKAAVRNLILCYIRPITIMAAHPSDVICILSICTSSIMVITFTFLKTLFLKKLTLDL